MILTACSSRCPDGSTAVTFLIFTPAPANHASAACTRDSGILLSSPIILGNFTSTSKGLNPIHFSYICSCSQISKGSSSHTCSSYSGFCSLHAITCFAPLYHHVRYPPHCWPLPWASEYVGVIPLSSSNLLAAESRRRNRPYRSLSFGKYPQ